MASDNKSKVTEIIPGTPGNVSAIGSANAPFIYTDWIGSHGIGANSVVSITLEASRHMTVGRDSVTDRVVVAHVRMPFDTIMALKEAITQVELLAKKPPTGTKQ